MKPSMSMEHADILPHIILPLTEWYHAHARRLPWRAHPTPYRVWLSEIMLQQTRVAAVMPYFDRFLAALPTVKSLAEADEELLMKLWQGLGYYNRARNLQRAARIVQEKYHGHIPGDFDTLLTLPGIGRYTAGAISSIAYGASHPAVDGNVLRVITRLTLYGEDILKDRTKRSVENELRGIYPAGSASVLNQALMELGATVCLPNGAPLCGECPLHGLCLARREQRIHEFPQKSKTKKRRVEELTVLLLEEDGKIALRKRGAKGLLAGLWELPHLAGHRTRKEILSFLREHRLTPASVRPLPDAVHIFSHVEWHMKGWHVCLAPAWSVAEPASLWGENAELVWAASKEIQEDYSIPAAFQYFLPHDLKQQKQPKSDEGPDD